MKNVRTVVVGMIKQSVLKQLKRGREWVKAKFYIGKRGDIKIIVIKRFKKDLTALCQQKDENIISRTTIHLPRT